MAGPDGPGGRRGELSGPLVGVPQRPLESPGARQREFVTGYLARPYLSHYLGRGGRQGRETPAHCFRRDDGRLLWEHAAPEAPGEKLYWKNTYASSTPASDGERIYAWFGNAGLIAVNLDGSRAWHHDFGTVTLYHGSGGSPLLHRDRVIFFQDQRSGSFIAALDRATGKLLWKTARQEKVGWSTPVAIHTGKREEIIVSSENRVTAYGPADGALLWHCAGNTFETIPTPVAGNGLVYCSSGRAGPTLAIRPGGSGDVTGSRVAWQTQRGSPFIPSPVLLGTRLYIVNDMTAIATCLDAVTGRSLWQGRLGEAASESFSASPVAVNGKIFFTNDNGETFVLADADSFRLLHVNAIGERTLASPALVDGVWYIRTEGHLFAIG